MRAAAGAERRPPWQGNAQVAPEARNFSFKYFHETVNRQHAGPVTGGLPKGEEIVSTPFQGKFVMNKVLATLIAGLFAAGAFAQTAAPAKAAAPVAAAAAVKVAATAAAAPVVAAPAAVVAPAAAPAVAAAPATMEEKKDAKADAAKMKEEKVAAKKAHDDEKKAAAAKLKEEKAAKKAAKTEAAPKA
jgi:hypothetical protein